MSQRLKNGVKILLGVGIAGALYYVGTQLMNKARQWADQVAVTVQGIGKPSTSAGTLIIPINLRVYNPAPFAIPVEHFIAAISIFQNNDWLFLGSTDPVSKNLAPGNNSISLNAKLSTTNLDSLFAGLTTGSLLDKLFNKSNGSLAKFQVDVTTRIAGYDIETSDTVDVSIATLLANA